MKKVIPVVLSSMLLASCSSIIDHQSQLITMRTPGATNARCLIENEDMKYSVFTDETIEIMKSPNDLVVRCQAPGNREQTVLVKREINGWVFANVANGFVPGATYDYFSRGAFDYPDVFTVSFVGDPVKPYPAPSYHNQDLRNYNDYNGVEYMGPTTKLTNGTMQSPLKTLQKKDDQYGGGSDFDGGSVAPARLDDIHRQYNPGVSSYDPTEEDK